MNPARVDWLVDLSYGVSIFAAIGLIILVGTDVGVAFGLGVLLSYVIHIGWKMARFDPDWMTTEVADQVKDAVTEEVEERVGDSISKEIDDVAEQVEQTVEEDVAKDIEETVTQQIEQTVAEEVDEVKEKLDEIEERTDADADQPKGNSGSRDET